MGEVSFQIKVASAVQTKDEAFSQLFAELRHGHDGHERVSSQRHDAQ